METEANKNVTELLQSHYNPVTELLQDCVF